MRYEELLDLLKEWNLPIVPTAEARVRGYDFETYKKLAKETERIDYDCDFQNGHCQFRSVGSPNCCHNCVNSFGYWRKEPGALDEATVRIMAEHFDARTGFLEEGSGCTLPRELRSPTCLYIYCSGDMMSGADKELLLKIQYGAFWS